jgi:hypothetical protein
VCNGSRARPTVNQPKLKTKIVDAHDLANRIERGSQISLDHTMIRGHLDLSYRVIKQQISLTNWTNGFGRSRSAAAARSRTRNPPIAPKLNRKRAWFVLAKIHEILAWEQRKEAEKDPALWSWEDIYAKYGPGSTGGWRT